MPTVVQFRRGTTAQNDVFVGAAGELSVDTEKDTLRVHDGVTAGGYELLTLDATQTITNKTPNQDWVPASDSAYDLGSPTNKWKDLYLSGNSIYLGDAKITSLDSAVILPTGSTILGGGSVLDSDKANALITSAINNLVDGAPTALDTLNELAAALDDDANFAATITNQLAALPDSAQVSAIITADVDQDFVNALNVNADTLDGQQGTHYLDYTNFTNTPNILDSANVSSIIVADVDQDFVNALNVNADTLDGQDANYYLDYTNFTNTPNVLDSGDVRNIFSAAGDLTYNSSTGEFSIDVETVYTKSNFDSDLDLAFATNAVTTTDLAEGSNLYYTAARADSDAKNAVSAGTGLSYNNATGEFSIPASGVTAGTYGSASLVPIITVDAQGFVDSVGEVSVAGVSSFDYDSATGQLVINTADGGTFAQTVTLDPFTTTDLSEGNNLYYTTTRADSDFDARLTTKTTDDVAEGTNLYYTKARVDSDVTAGIDALVAGAPTALDTLNELAAALDDDPNFAATITAQLSALPDSDQVRTLVSAVDAGGDGSFSYNSSTGEFTYTGPSASEVRAHLSAAGDLSYNSGTGEFSVTTYKSTDFDTDFSGKSTTDLSEGNNLYYTTARADSDAKNAVSATDAGGDGSFSYNSSTGVFTYTGPSAAEARAHFSASGDLSYNSTTGDFSVTTYKTADFNTDFGNKTTTDLTEGNNLYYTTLRADSDARHAISVTDAGGDGSFSYNVSTGELTYTGPSAAEARAHFSGGTGITYNSSTGEFTTTDNEIVHDNLSGFVANEHIDHSGVSITAGSGLTGGGNITASRTLNIGQGTGITVSADAISTNDAQIVHDNLSGFVSNEHIDHSSVSITAGNGLTGGGDITTTRTINVVGGGGINVSADNISIDSAEIRALVSGGTGITYNSSTGEFTTTDTEIVHDNLSGFVANEHIDHSGVSITAGSGLTGGGDITSSRTLNIGQGTGITVAADAISTNDAQIVHDNLSGFVANEHIDHSSVTLTAGAGLTGGGDITSSRTFNIGAGTGITVNADDIAVNMSAFTTTNLAEGNNLYYTTARADSDAKNAVSASGDLSYDPETGIFSITVADAALSDSGVRSKLSAVDAGGDGSFSYNQATGQFTYTGPSASEVRAHFSAGTGVTLSSGQISIGQDVSTTADVTFNSVETTNGLVVNGDLQVNGTTTTVNSQNLSIEDNMIYLNQLESAGSPTLSVDIGWAGNYNDDGSYAHAGMFRDATDNTFKVYQGYTPEPDSSFEINTGHGSFELAPFSAGTLSGKYLGFDSDFGDKSTSDLTEGSNLYYTTARADSDAKNAVSAGTGVSYNASTGVISSNDAQIVHDNLSGFVSNEHIDHTTVSITAGSGLTGGGTIAATRTLNIGEGTGITVSADAISTNDAEIVHDNLSGFVSNEHVDHSSVSITAGAGLTGGGDITSSRTLNVVGGGGINVNADNITIDSAEIRALVSGSTGITYNSGTGVFTTNDGQIVHDNLSGFVANEHIDHSGVSITAGSGLTGGGNITTSRTLNIGEGTGITVSADAISTNDAEIVHDNLSGFVANEHIDHTSVSITAGNGLTGGGTIAASRTINVVGGGGINVGADNISIDSAEIRALISGSTGITYNSTTGAITTNDAQIVHDNLSGFVANEHIDHSSVSITAGSGLTGGGTIAATRTLNIGEGTGITVSADTISTNDAEIVHDNLSGFVANEHIDHSAVQVVAGNGLTGGGTIAASRTLNVVGGGGITVNADNITIDSADIRALFSGSSGITYNSSTGAFTHSDTSSASSVNNSGNTFIQDITIDGNGHVTAIGSGTVTVNDATITVSAGVGLSGGGNFTTNQGSNETLTLTLDMSELTDMTATMVGTDEFIVLDAGADRRKAASEIGLSIFNNDAGFTTYDSSNATGQINTAIANLIDNAPAALDTLNELAAALGDDANFSTTVTNAIAALPDSAQVRGLLSGSTGITYNSTTGAISTNDGQIVHDNLSGFVANEHINHSSVSITAGNGLTGGGDITSTRTLNVGAGSYIIVNADDIDVDATSANTASKVVARDGSGNFSAGTITATLSGNASTATTATNVTATANNSTNETTYLTFVDGATGAQGIETDTGLTYNPSTGVLSSVDFNSTSDVSLKENIETINDAANKVNALRGVNFNWKDNSRYAMGVIAQEVEQVIPEVVATKEDGTKTVSYGAMVGLLIEAVKDLQNQIDELKK